MISDDMRNLYHRAKWALILRGVFGLVIGIYILARPLQSVAAFALVIALWALIDGVTAVVHAIELRDIAPHWGWLFVAGIVSICFGIAALYYYPGLSLAFAVAWTAYWLVTAGVIAVWVSVQERRNQMSWGWTMIFGLIAVATGVLAFVYPGVTLTALMAIISAYGIVGGIALLIGAGRMSAAVRRVRSAFDYQGSSSGRRDEEGAPPDKRSVA